MKIELQRNVRLVSYDVLMDIGIRQKKPVHLAILKAIEETDGKANPAYIAKNLLGNRPKIAAENIIRRCISLNLVNEKWELTADGKKSLETEMIFVPERGAYRIWVAADPFLPSRIVYKEAIQEDDNINKIQFESELKPEFKKANVSLPQEILDLKDAEISLLGNTREFIKIIEIHGKGRKVSLDEDDKLVIKLQIDSSENYPKVIASGDLGNLNVFSNELQTDFGLSWEFVWKNLLGTDYTKWEPLKKQLKVNFDDLNDKEKYSFLSVKSFEKPQLQNFGHFDNAKVENIPIISLDLTQAQKWFDWLIMNTEPKSYCNKKNFDKFITFIRGKFKDYIEGIKAPDQKSLAEKIKKRDLVKNGKLTKSYWRLQAPIDLELGGQ